MANNETPIRKKNRLNHYDYSNCGAYFLTICTAKRCNLLWHDVPSDVGAIIDRPLNSELSPYGKIVEKAINDIPSIYPVVEIDYYVIMPDHIHLLLSIHADENGRPMVAPTVSRIVKQFKGSVTRQLGRSIWQKSFFDHIIRNKEDYEKHAKYIYENPLALYYDRGGH
ncbi:MAG: transposase [Clostridia bacterium]|nr:transposase [Clostridia bacterium]